MLKTLILAPILLPWAGALLILLVRARQPRLIQTLATLFSLGGALAVVALFGFVSSEAPLSITLGSAFGRLSFTPDGLALYLAAIATIIGTLAVIFSTEYMHNERDLRRYYALVLFFIGSMSGLVLSSSLLFMFFFWEITAFCSYALISFHNDDPRAVYGGIKALVITSLGGVGLLIGSMLAINQFGDDQIGTFLLRSNELPANTLSFIAFAFLAAAAAKSAQIPFHTWLPDAMEAPTPVSALIHAATMVNAGVYLLARFYPAFHNVPGWTMTLILMGCLTSLSAALMALLASDLKRVLAYSTISQLGFMVYAIGIGAIYASQLHLLSHAIFKALLFLGAGAIIHVTGTRDLEQMGQLSRRMPWVTATFLIGAFALAGLPFTNSFYSKELILESAWTYGPAWSYVLMVAGAGITALYTYRMVSKVFFGTIASKVHAYDPSTAMLIPLGILALGTLSSWLLAGPFSTLLVTSMPFHEFPGSHLTASLLEILRSPITWMSLSIILITASLWHLPDHVKTRLSTRKFVKTWNTSNMGFERVNSWVVRTTQRSGRFTQTMQTGVLKWNLILILGSLAILLGLPWR